MLAHVSWLLWMWNIYKKCVWGSTETLPKVKSTAMFACFASNYGNIFLGLWEEHFIFSIINSFPGIVICWGSCLMDNVILFFLVCETDYVWVFTVVWSKFIFQIWTFLRMNMKMYIFTVLYDSFHPQWLINNVSKGQIQRLRLICHLTFSIDSNKGATTGLCSGEKLLTLSPAVSFRCLSIIKDKLVQSYSLYQLKTGTSVNDCCTVNSSVFTVVVVCVLVICMFCMWMFFHVAIKYCPCGVLPLVVTLMFALSQITLVA